jgi:mono/diheme cytochrome c family protein
MKLLSTRLPQAKLGRGLLVLAGLLALVGPAQAQNIDEGKTAPQLFAATCAACHRNPGALAKGRFRPTLFAFLKDHYTTGSSEAWALASYLAAVETPPARSQKAKQAKAGTRASSTRPPGSVPSAQ